MKFTRSDYIDGKCTHQEYYSQFVTEESKRLVIRFIGSKDFLSQKYEADNNLNNIPLHQWDAIALYYKHIGAIDENGTGVKIYYRSNAICVLKTAAMMIVKGESK